MKTCMTLILASATLYLSAAEGRAAKKCNNPEPMTPFDKDKFFKDAWYITHYKFTDTESNDDKYRTKLLQKIENGNIKEVFSIYGPKKQNYSYYISLSSNTSFEGTYGKYTAKHIKVDKDGKKLEERSLSVTYLGTDYNSYSVVYVCEKMKDGKLFSLYAVQSRQGTLEENVKTKVKSVLQSINLSLDKLSSIKDANCQFDNSTLNTLLSQTSTYET